jgi:sugar phosphate isomerase/epimerase
MRNTILLTLALAANLTAAPIPEAAYENGIAIGTQAYSFKEFTAFEAIAKTKEAGGKTIEFYPGQKLKPDSSETVSHNASAEVKKALLEECKRQGISPVNYGVVGAKNAEEVDKIMAFAKEMGLYAVCTESTEQIVAWEAAAKKYDVKVAFHEHGGSMSKPDYKVWHPL